MALTQLEKDLERYACEKMTRAMSDVAQAFEIAGHNKAWSLPLLGAVTLRISALLANAMNMPKEVFMQQAARLYDQEEHNVPKGD